MHRLFAADWEVVGIYDGADYMETQPDEWLFGIGATMHPFILEKRGIAPSEIKPAILKDYEVTFIKYAGMGIAKPKPGCNFFHGVL
jgi:hypothetical protein